MERKPRLAKDSGHSGARQSGPLPASQVLDLIRVNSDAPLPLAAQLRQQIEWLLSSGHIKPGERLPPVRALAEQLGIHRHTVLVAYQQLRAGGLLTMRQGRGSVVSPDAIESLRHHSATVPTFTVGVLVPGLNPFYTPFLQGIEETARNGPWLLLVCYTHDQPQLASRYLDQLVAKQVDGLIIAAGLPATEGEPRNLPQSSGQAEWPRGAYRMLLLADQEPVAESP